MKHRIGVEFVSPDAAVREVSDTECGAIATFIGTVRALSRGRAVTALEYEAFEPMALKTFARIESEAGARWPGCRLVIHHRVGRLLPGETSVAIAAASAHREDAFAACRYAIEALKADAPIWKREQYRDGSAWIGLGS